MYEWEKDNTTNHARPNEIREKNEMGKRECRILGYLAFISAIHFARWYFSPYSLPLGACTHVRIYINVCACAFACTHSQSIQRMSRHYMGCCVFTLPESNAYTMAEVRKRTPTARGKKIERIGKRRRAEKKKKKKLKKGERTKAEENSDVPWSRVVWGEGAPGPSSSWAYKGSLPSTPRFNHPTDCLQLRVPKFLLSLFSPLSFSLSFGSFFSILFSLFLFIVVFTFSLFLSRIDRTSALESVFVDINAFYISFIDERKNAWYFVEKMVSISLVSYIKEIRNKDIRYICKKISNFERFVNI